MLAEPSEPEEQRAVGGAAVLDGVAAVVDGGAGDAEGASGGMLLTEEAVGRWRVGASELVVADVEDRWRVVASELVTVVEARAAGGTWRTVGAEVSCGLPLTVRPVETWAARVPAEWK